jgi:hypothetical protein
MKMYRFTSKIRTPVRREGADQYLLVTLLSFALSVTLTRLFLELTGYPQLGGGELHIAHVLWGGLLLFAASLAPLIISNRWVYNLSAVLSGVGVGLFIDEVGKFITASNDYFYPLAAPIIYAFFLLTVFLYLGIRRPPSLGARAELYRAIDSLEEILEHDLQPHERAELAERLRYVTEKDEVPQLSMLANKLLDFIEDDSLELAPEQDHFWKNWRIYWQKIENDWISPSRTKWAISVGLLVLGTIAIINLIRLLPINDSLETIIKELVQGGQIQGQRGLNWFAARIALEVSIGMLLISAALLILRGEENLGAALGRLGLLLSLTTVNLLVFFFDQFSTIILASIQFIILLGLGYYQRILNKQNITSTTTPDDTSH